MKQQTVLTKRLTEGRCDERLITALRAVSGELGLDPVGARLLRNVNNAVFQLARDPVVIRLVTLPSYVPRASLAVAAATVFAEHDVPAIRLLPGVRQPVRVGEHVATVWQSVPPTGPPPGGAGLAGLLRAVHAVPLPCRALPAWDPLTDFDNRVRHTTAMAGADRDFLLCRSAELASAVANLRFALPTAVLHGDAHVGNIIPGSDHPVLCDFDSCAVGPPEWDLTPVAVSSVRFTRPAARLRDFIDTYGFDVRDWDGFEVLHGIRDLKLIAGVFPRAMSSPAVQAEFDRRMASLRAGRLSDRWRTVRR
ncbi:MAG: aminoglycoside phosphotransferase family protein [Pseudonocardiales bacterium]|nr:aminoglycoside phosphotransferase family protein [Pseudonocardiales bacterium]